MEFTPGSQGLQNHPSTRHIQIHDERNGRPGVALLSVHLQFSVKQRQQMRTDLIMKKLENRANIMKRDTNYVVSVEDTTHWQQSSKSTDYEYVGKLDKKWKLSSILENKRRNMGQKWGEDEKSLKSLQSSGLCGQWCWFKTMHTVNILVYWQLLQHAKSRV